MFRITPPPWLQHDRHRGARAEVDADDVDAVDAVEILRRGLLDRADVRDAGVVDEDVEAGRRGGHRAEEGLDRRGLRHVAGIAGRRCRPPR